MWARQTEGGRGEDVAQIANSLGLRKGRAGLHSTGRTRDRVGVDRLRTSTALRVGQLAEEARQLKNTRAAAPTLRSSPLVDLAFSARWFGTTSPCGFWWKTLNTGFASTGPIR
jgi:hypothetical protein